MDNITLKLKSISKQLFDKKNRLKLIILVGIVGISLIFLSELAPVKTDATITQNNDDALSDFQNHMQEKLSEIISSIDGVGKSKILITLKNSEETIYAQEEKLDEESSQTFEQTPNSRRTVERNYIVVNDSSGGKQALVEKTLTPTIQGVVVVCDGGDNKDVVLQVTQAIMIACDISSTKVAVLKLS